MGGGGGLGASGLMNVVGTTTMATTTPASGAAVGSGIGGFGELRMTERERERQREMERERERERERGYDVGVGGREREREREREGGREGYMKGGSGRRDDVGELSFLFLGERYVVCFFFGVFTLFGGGGRFLLSFLLNTVSRFNSFPFHRFTL